MGAGPWFRVSIAMGTGRELSIVDRAILSVATGFGFGFSPWMPGTFGAVWGLPLAFGVAHCGGLLWPSVAIFGCFLVGVPICGKAVALLGRKKDPGAIVWDEIASMPIVFLGIGPERLGVGDFSGADWRIYLAGFVLHRIFDIAKPPPARQAERLPGGWGIMADDAVAAVMACGCLHGLDWLGMFG